MIVIKEKGCKGRSPETALAWDPYLLAWLDGGQRDALAVDDGQDLVADDSGDDLALGVCQELGGDWLHLKALSATRCLA